MEATISTIKTVFVNLCLSVVMDVQDSTHVNCKLYKGLSDALICTDDFIAKVVQRYVMLLKENKNSSLETVVYV